MANVILQTEIPGVPVRHGKVRDIYDLGDKLIISASDRLSAFDVIMKTGIPNKGAVLTKISEFWFKLLKDIPNHLITTDIRKFPDPFWDYPDQLSGRSMLVKKTDVIPIECIVRGYITGSGWKDYKADGTVCGIELPKGLLQCQMLPEVLFTPSSKAEHGDHDENITFDRGVEIIAKAFRDLDANKIMQEIKTLSLNIYMIAHGYAKSKGIILADTKFEWGIDKDGNIILIDEVFTPDSSRFWPADKYEAGRDQESFDKQFVRNYLEEINFDKDGEGIELPEDITMKTMAKYIEAFELLTGKKFAV